MSPTTFVKRSRIPVSARQVFEWHARPGAFERLNPPWNPVEVVQRTGGVAKGARTVLRAGVGSLKQTWVHEHSDCLEGEQFVDVQTRGPFARWVHTHRMDADGPEACWLEDRLEVALPGGPAGRPLTEAFVRRNVAQVFAYRHRITTDDLIAHARAEGSGSMKVLVTGSSGLVGSALIPFLTAGGHQVVRLVRKEPVADEVHWDPAAGAVAWDGSAGVDAVVHLAGENLVGAWTEDKKARIRDSRVTGTRLLCEAVSQCPEKPGVVVVASALGFYGDRGEEVVDETAPPGTGFLAEVCTDWEAAAQPAVEAGIRVVKLRIGVVLTPRGGALGKMLGPFRAGLGGRMGSGKQWMSWIGIDDLLGALHCALTTDQLSGPVNAVAPNPVTQIEFAQTLGKVLRRPTLAAMPAFAARMAFGEMADEMLLASTRVAPTQLRAAGYEFRFPHLEEALRHLLGKSVSEGEGL